MKRLHVRTKILLGALVIIAQACGGGGGGGGGGNPNPTPQPTPADFDRRALLSSYTEQIVLPALRQFATDAAALEAAAAALAAATDGAFDPSVEPLLRVGTTSEHSFVAPNQAVPPQTEILWQVVAHDSRGAHTGGPLWRFGTASTDNHPPNPITAPFPADEDTAISVAVVLRWEGGEDPEDGQIEFEVLLDTTPNLAGPELVTVNGIQVRELDPPGDLDPATTYYWRIIRDKDGEFIVTMEHPRESAPKPVIIDVDRFKARVKREQSVGAAALTAVSAPRAG